MSGINYLNRVTGAANNIVYLETSDTVATATTANYITAQATNILSLTHGGWTWETNDFIIISASDGVALATINAAFTTLELIVFSTTVIGAPVVVGDFAVFASTSGNIEDLGYLPSDAAKTVVVMANGATVANRLAVFTDTAGTIDDTTAAATHAGSIYAGLSGTAGVLRSYPAGATSGYLGLTGVANSGDFGIQISNASMGQATVVSITDPGASTANFLLSASATVQHVTAGAFQVDAGAISSGLSTGGFVGLVKAFPTTGSKGFIAIQGAVNATGNFGTTISNATTQGQAQVITIPDSGASTANFLLDTGTNATMTVTTATITNLKYGATPVAQVDPASCTITAAAGAANHSTITVQLKDGSGTNMSRVIPFKVYLATTNSGLILQSAASTGYSVTSGGVVDPTGSTTVTQGLAAFSSATGGCVIDLLDTAKGTGNLILMLPNGFKASAAITSGSYG